ncbi:MAG: hypothetical protein Q8L60_09090 [Gammaproteobacteria bacterium]|nr:hypothetical protein [Gammaproteobacteria bacterium]MDP2140592.1 hypothetical protein [Gammaproteobacteria bacterium]MDP2347364.1 hypothetical protein [Gammaproteobacteria bacterium]
MTPTLRLLPCIIFTVTSTAAIADNPVHHNGVNRVYEPYVQPLEREWEWRSYYQTDDDPSESDILRQRIGYGTSINERVFAELYLNAMKLPGGSLRLESYELESRIQLTEQGEYAADWGLLIELERERSESVSEVAAAVLVSRQWGNWVGTLNVGVEYEFGSDVDNEFETFMSAQWRLRYRESLEPGLEFYADEYTRGIGPVLTGLIRGEGNRKWHWETGVILPLNKTTPDVTYRVLLEFEF